MAINQDSVGGEANRISALPDKLLEAVQSQRPLPTLNADILREIFLRANSRADLARAAAACLDFCHLIADPSFLRRYRSLHPPLLLGFIDCDSLHPVPPPHPNAIAARAFARIVDSSFSCLLPDRGFVDDVRDGRILLQLVDHKKRSILLSEGFCYLASCDLAVCDPLSRGYKLVPPMPDDVLSSAQIQRSNIINFDTILAPFEDFEETSFRVIRCILVKTALVLFVFSSISGQWSVSTSTSWDALRLDAPKSWMRVLVSRSYVYGCFYWKVKQKNKLLKLDMNTMKFSTHDLPPDQAEHRAVIVEAGDDKLAMFSQIDGGSSLDYYTFLPNGSKKGGEWHMKNTVMLPSQFECHMFCHCQSEGHIFLFGQPKGKFIKHHVCFALDINTFTVERLSGTYALTTQFPYSCFPPIISPRKVQGCKRD